MDDSFSTARTRAGRSGSAPADRRSLGRRRVQPHHRRRRFVALLVLVGLVVLIGVMLGSGGSSATVVRTSAQAKPSYFTRLEILAGTGNGSFLGAEKAAENAAIDKTLSYTPYVQVAGAQHRELALTFDDGPGPYTPQFVSLLKQYHTPATFFEVGIAEQYFHEGTSLIAQAGFPIGDHTYSHAPMSQLSVPEQQTQLQQQITATGRYGAPYPRLFRPPYGLSNNTTLSVLKQFRMLMVLWTIDTSDYRLPGVDAIIHTVVSQARPGAIVLMHDAGGNRTETLAALPTIIKELRARGYTLVTVPKLLLDNPAPANQNASAITGSGG
jgi:peptidoglycan/xylan/chitin deacetylase (PgdA/CDA1 family)